MSESETFNQRARRRLKQELDELDNPRAQYQAILDRWVQSQRDEAAEYRRMMRELNPVGLVIWD
jgi:hypothetical protein